MLGAGIKKDGRQAAFTWQNGITTILPTISGKYWHQVVMAINNAGIIVGHVWRYTPPISVRAYIWNGRQVNYLDDLVDAGSGWKLEEANDINSKVQIVGTGKLKGVLHGFLLNPIPESESIAINP